MIWTSFLSEKLYNLLKKWGQQYIEMYRTMKLFISSKKKPIQFLLVGVFLRHLNARRVTIADVLLRIETNTAAYDLSLAALPKEVQ